MDAGLENKLIECLDALESGQSIEQTLALYPEDAAALRPLLETASQINQIRVAHSLEAQAKSRERFLAQGAALTATASRPKAAFFGLSRLALSMTSLLILLVIVGAGLVFAASETVPGDALYGTKRIVEEVRLSLSPGAHNRASLADKFQRERLREIGVLLQDGRSVDVTFSGVVEATDGDTWHVAGVTVMVDALTQIEDQPQLGWTIKVKGTTEAGQVLATEVTIVERDGNEPVPEPKATEADETNVDQSAKPTATPSHTPSPTPTATPPATSTPAATVPDAPQPVPTVDDDSNHDDASASDDNNGADEPEDSEDESPDDSGQSDDNSGGGSQEEQSDDGETGHDDPDDQSGGDDHSDDGESSDEDGRVSDDGRSSDGHAEDGPESDTVQPSD